MRVEETSFITTYHGTIFLVTIPLKNKISILLIGAIGIMIINIKKNVKIIKTKNACSLVQVQNISVRIKYEHLM